MKQILLNRQNYNSHLNLDGMKYSLFTCILLICMYAANSQNNWTQKKDFGGVGRYSAVGFSIGTKGYIGTGNKNFSQNVNDFWEYDAAADSWTQKADFAGRQRCKAVGFSINGKGYIGTGYASGCLNDFWQYDPLTNIWLQKASFPGEPRQQAVGFSINAKGYIGTGLNSSSNGLSDFWEYNPTGDTWTKKSDFGGGLRYNATGFFIGNKGYIGTGRNGSSLFSDFWEYDPIGDNWNKKADIGGIVREGGTGFSINAEGYIGIGDNGNSLNDFWEYNPAADTWQQETNFAGTARWLAVGFSIGNTGYIGTGVHGSIYNDFWEYTPNSDSWAQKKDFSGLQRAGAVGFSIGAKGYIGTGTTGSDITSSDFTNDFWEYDAAADTWTQKADFAGGLIAYAASFSINGKGYIGTGEYGSTYVSSFWEYDPSANTWIKKANFPGESRGEAVGFSIGNKGYIGTGYDADVHNSGMSDFWEYDPSTDSWTKKADFSGGSRYRATGFSIDNKGYIGTGYSNSNLFNDFWEYDPNTNSWTKKANVGKGTREYATSFSIGSRGYVGMGSQNYSSSFNDFWEYNPAADVWVQRTSLSAPARQQAVGFSISNKGYIGIGIDYYGLTVYNDFWEYTPTLNRITTNAITGSPFCAGSSVNVSFTTTGVANNGNIFAAQLSNSAGSFASPVNIGSLSSISSGTINAVIPSNISSGNGYRIRVVSSNPAITGFDNGTNITIVARTLFYRDADLDGFGDPNSSPLLGCNAPFGYVANNLDCDDTRPYVYPGAQEICGDGIDDNCNGQIDEGCPICANANGLTTSNITSNSATLNWTASINPVRWQVQYKKAGAAWARLTVGAAKRVVTISSLTANSTYKWRIRAKCGSTWTGFSDTLQFKTLKASQIMSAQHTDLLQTLNTENTLKLYPNPSNGRFTVELHLSSNINTNAKIELINMVGKIVLTETANMSNGILKNDTSISSSLIPGIYLVRITVHDNTYQAKLVYAK